MAHAALKNTSVIFAQFILGGLTYCALEILYRGYSHPSMLIAGGLCFVLLCRVAWSRLNLLQGAVIGALIITTVELAVGIIVNLWLGLRVWDYSTLPLNLWGQVSLYYTLIWFALSALVILLARIIRGSALLYMERLREESILYK